LCVRLFHPTHNALQIFSSTLRGFHRYYRADGSDIAVTAAQMAPGSNTLVFIMRPLAQKPMYTARLYSTATEDSNTYLNKDPAPNVRFGS
jgi:hypothetical protein